MNDKEKFKTAYADLSLPDRRYVWIYQLRRRLGWPPERFNRTLDALLTNGICAAYPLGPNSLTPGRLKDSFTGKDGETYIAIAWLK